MKLQIMSDLHMMQWARSHGSRHYWQDRFPEETQTDADVLILAGDITNLGRSYIDHARARLTEFAVRYKHVLYVPGNHEFYGTGIGDGLDLLYELQATIPGFDVLREDHPVIIGGQRFLGATAWLPDSARGAAPITDHYQIKDFDPVSFDEHYRFVEFLQRELRAEDVVVTHHAPSNLSLDPLWYGDPCNPWFIAPDLERFIRERQPKLWVHGHTHTPFDYRIGNTRVVSNPKGYPNEGVRFNPKLVIEL